MGDKAKGIIKKAGIALFYLVVWQLAAELVGSELLLPSPLVTAQSLFSLAVTGKFWLSTLMSILRVVAGFLAGVLLGALMGVLTSTLPMADALLAPLRSIVKATPVTSFIILVLLWLTSTATPVFIAFLMVLPMVWTNVHEGILATDKKLVEMGRVFRLPFYKRVRYIYAPSVAPQFLAACTTGLGFAWKAGVTAEVLSRPELSIGKSLIESKLYIDTPALFAWTAVVVLMSILMERGVVALAHRRGR